jgi:hypothetical protein
VCVGGVVRDDRSEELDVLARVRRLLGERLDELLVDLLGPPGKRAVFRDELEPVPLHRRIVVVRQLLEWRGAVGVHVDEVSRRLVDEPRGAPQIGINRMLDDRRRVLLEEGDGSPPAGAQSPSP